MCAASFEFVGKGVCHAWCEVLVDGTKKATDECTDVRDSLLVVCVAACSKELIDSKAIAGYEGDAVLISKSPQQWRRTKDMPSSSSA